MILLPTSKSKKCSSFYKLFRNLETTDWIKENIMKLRKNLTLLESDLDRNWQKIIESQKEIKLKESIEEVFLRY